MKRESPAELTEQWYKAGLLEGCETLGRTQMSVGKESRVPVRGMLRGDAEEAGYGVWLLALRESLTHSKLERNMVKFLL